MAVGRQRPGAAVRERRAARSTPRLTGRPAGSPRTPAGHRAGRPEWSR
jgi:hypothetical protein